MYKLYIYSIEFIFDFAVIVSIFKNVFCVWVKKMGASWSENGNRFWLHSWCVIEV